MNADPELRSLGRSGLRVSPVGFGLAAVGRPAYINIGHSQDLGPERSVEALRRRSEALLDAAYAAGIRYYDAAIKTSPSCLPAVHGLRDLYRRREDWPRVIETLELEVKLWSDTGEVFVTEPKEAVD